MNRNWLIQRGFEDFLSVAGLRIGGISDVPKEGGVYAVVREVTGEPLYLSKNPCWHFKGWEPTVDCSCLKKRWVPRASVLYFGRTGGLKKRIKDLIDFGAGEHASHWGGRLIWQVSGAEDFTVFWCINNDPIALKCKIINEFIEKYDQPPFANIQYRLS